MYSQRRLFLLLLKPSVSSALITASVTIGTFAAITWSYFTHNSLFYNYLYGPQGIVATLVANNFFLTTSQAFSVWLAQSWLYYIVVLLIAVAVTAIVFVGLQLVWGLIFSVEKDVQDVQLTASRAAKRSKERDIVVRLAVRLSVAIIWILYGQLWLSVIAPTYVLLSSDTLNNLNSPLYWLHGLLACVFFLVSLHVHIILLRLLLLRPRVFYNRLDAV
ncbi:MAG TPA: hypothetical protein VH144_00665 [Candidatus Saccharimonadales bacterium]|jgi:hypothetical protein|nr:hypothetical protein [Candidatus Saccharimonadales bacterium]